MDSQSKLLTPNHLHRIVQAGAGAMAKYKVTLKYVGTRYAGWQIQKNQDTVQGQLRDALNTITGHPISVVGAGPVSYTHLRAHETREQMVLPMHSY